MAATRPVVLVFQEFGTLSSPAATPELNCLVAGPAYWIQDFPEDRDSIKLTEVYGTKDKAATGASDAPINSTPVIELTDAPNNKVGAILDADSVRVFFGAPRVELAFGTDLVATVGSPDVTSATADFVAAGVKTGDIVVLTDSSAGSTVVTRVRSIDSAQPHALTLADDVTATTYSAFRVERAVAEAEIDKSFVSVTAGTNAITVLGGVTLGGKKVTYAEVYVAYRSLRQDLAKVTALSVTEIASTLGRIDARNPLAAGAFVAAQNTPTTIQVYGVTSDDLTGYNQMKGAIAGRNDIYAVVPLTSDVNVLASLNADFVNFADPDYAVTNGVPQKFRVVIGSAGELPQTKTVVTEAANGTVESTTTATVTGDRTVTFSAGVDLITLGILPGYKLSFDAGETWAYTVAQVNSADSLETEEAATAPGSAADVSFQKPDGTVVVGGTGITVTVAAADALYLDLYVATGKFLDDGVIAGDLLQMPANPSALDFTTYDSFEIATVVSNQRLRIKNTGPSTGLTAHELPHGATRTAPVTAVPTTATLAYRVVRTLDKAGQVTELVAVAQSLKSRRAILCWPDKVDVASLVDGSLTRDPAAPTVARAAGPQPGYYLACAVGGMTAGLPSQQGFTNLGIAGIKEIYNANNYFGDKEITQISNGGWMVFQQDAPAALPYCVHQLTTDPATLEFGEYSLVKNFDFVSMFYRDILDEFVGPWNINKETLGFIKAAVDAGTDNLKLRKKPRIGAPIKSGKIASLQESDISADRLDLFVELDMPKPLNTVALHLVSV